LQITELSVQRGVVVAVVLAPVAQGGEAEGVPLADAVAGAVVAGGVGVKAGFFFDVGQHAAGGGGVESDVVFQKIKNDLRIGCGVYAEGKTAHQQQGRQQSGQEFFHKCTLLGTNNFLLCL